MQSVACLLINSHGKSLSLLGALGYPERLIRLPVGQEEPIGPAPCPVRPFALLSPLLQTFQEWCCGQDLPPMPRAPPGLALRPCPQLHEGHDPAPGTWGGTSSQNSSSYNNHNHLQSKEMFMVFLSEKRNASQPRSYAWESTTLHKR